MQEGSIEDNQNSIEGGRQRRVFPPPYTATGNVSADRLAFFHVLERLKVGRTYLTLLYRGLVYMLLQTQKRTGWMDKNVRISFRQHSTADVNLTYFDPDSKS